MLHVYNIDSDNNKLYNMYDVYMQLFKSGHSQPWLIFKYRILQTAKNQGMRVIVICPTPDSPSVLTW